MDCQNLVYKMNMRTLYNEIKSIKYKFELHNLYIEIFNLMIAYQ